ncbi:MAG: hypothetical protein RL738_512 [Bacteroidota bacterium]
MLRRVKAPFHWVWGLFILLPSAAGQVVVVNGLGHFHSWEAPTVGEIVLMNPSSDSLRVLIYRDSLWGPQHPCRSPAKFFCPAKADAAYRTPGWAAIPLARARACSS